MTERQSKLIKLVNIYQKIEVSRLAELLDVSQVTIRKDLDHLEDEGLLTREHGYALIKNANDINTRLTINYDTKLKIATKAAEMVSNGETVMLESGSTCALLAEQLAKLKRISPSSPILPTSPSVSGRCRYARSSCWAENIRKNTRAWSAPLSANVPKSFSWTSFLWAPTVLFRMPVLPATI